MKQITHSGISAHFRDGIGHPLLFIHGFCEDSRMWGSLIQQLPEYPVLCVDLPGFGASPLNKSVDIADMANSIWDVANHLSLKNLICFGHSMGGYVALALAAQAPELLSGLGLIHTHPFADREEKKQARNKALEFLEKQGVPAFVKQLIPSLFAPGFLKNNPNQVELLIRQASEYSTEAVSNALRAMRDRLDRSDVLTALTIPALFLIGKLDSVIPADLNEQQILLPSIAEVVILENVGHMSTLEAPQKCAQAVRQFTALCNNY